MDLKNVQRIELPATADMHVHLRQGDMMELVAPTLTAGGVDTAFVMPNLVPPVTTVEMALEYKQKLLAVNPNVNYLMSLFLHSTVTPDVIDKAAAAGVTGVKLYPQGATTNSDNGVADLKAFYDTFEAMERNDMVLNLHGEALEALAPAGMTLEEAFLPTLKSLHERFPKLRIILEHCTTSAAVEAVKACGPNVGATITAHHLYLTDADACCNPFAFCKPIPKKPLDRDALIKAAMSGNPKFFFGSDSAPHPIENKTSAEQGKAPAGVFTQPFVTQLVVLALQEGIERGVLADADVTQEKLENFLSKNGRAFYKLPQTTRRIVLEKKETIPTSVKSATVEVGNSRHGDEADLSNGRQEELPLNRVAERGRSSFQPPREDLSQGYDPQIKQDLESNWSTPIVDAEAQQMAGLTNLNARPWASSGQPQASHFVMPKTKPPAVPQQVVRQQAMPQQALTPATTPSPSKPTVSTKVPPAQVVYSGKCEVTLHDGRLIVRDAEVRVEVPADRAALFQLAAPGKPVLALSVLDIDTPAIYGTSCIVKTRPIAGGETTVYAVKPIAPATADHLVRVLVSLQTVIRKRMGLEPAPKPLIAPPTPQDAKITPRSLICADSPESSPEQSPRLASHRLIEVAARRQNGKAPVSMEEVFSQINGIVRTSYYQITGCSAPMMPAASSKEQNGDVAMTEWLDKGKLDSEAEETKRDLLLILRFMRELQIKRGASREPPMMSSQTMEVFKTIDRGIKSQGGGVSYSASEIMELKKAAVVPANMKAKRGLSSSLWAKK